MRYETSVTGVLNNDTIDNLGGIPVSIFFWIPIMTFVTDGDHLTFKAA
jgi:hypothetical protein